MRNEEWSMQRRIRRQVRRGGVGGCMSWETMRFIADLIQTGYEAQRRKIRDVISDCCDK